MDIFLGEYFIPWHSSKNQKFEARIIRTYFSNGEFYGMRYFHQILVPQSSDSSNPMFNYTSYDDRKTRRNHQSMVTGSTNQKLGKIQIKKNFEVLCSLL